MATPITSRIQVYLKLKAVHDIYFKLAAFGECIVDYFGFADEGEGYVSLHHEGNQIILEKSYDGKTPNTVLLKHAVECPVFKLKCNNPTFPEEISTKGVGFGVVVLLTSSDQQVLVTRRASHMRTFPGVWVPPGGHLELGESILQAGVRELKEETGLECNENLYHILGLWESVYPHKLDYGEPLRHHLVAYIAIESTLCSNELTKLIQLNLEETDAALWLPSGFVEKITTGLTTEDIPVHMRLIQQIDGSLQQTQFETAPVVDAIAPSPQVTPLELDRLTWGTRFALRQWLKWLQFNSTTRNNARL